MRWCPRTRAYAKRRTTEGLSKPEILRCIKRYLAREVYHALVADFETPPRDSGPRRSLGMSDW